MKSKSSESVSLIWLFNVDEGKDKAMVSWSGVAKSVRDYFAKLAYKSRSGAKHINLGKLGEDLAVNALRAGRYTIVARNAKIYNHEIDIIAKDGGLLVFIEVKTRSSRSHGKPLEAINNKRRKRLRKAAELYMAREKINGISIRFDVVSVDLSNDGEPVVEIVRNAF